MPLQLGCNLLRFFDVMDYVFERHRFSPVFPGFFCMYGNLKTFTFLAGRWWRMCLTAALRQRRVNLCALQSEFQDSPVYTEKYCLKKQKTKQKVTFRSNTGVTHGFGI